MPLVLDPDRVPEPLLKELLRSLRNDLAETENLIRNPPGRVLDPASLATADDLLRSVRVLLDRVRGADPADLAAQSNLAYATLLAVIDLVKSHTDVPKVPPPRPAKPSSK